MHVLPRLMMKMVLVVLTAVLLSVMVAAAEGTSGKVTADALRVRAGASTDTEILGLLYNGTVVQLTGEEGDWYTISYNGATGYLHKDYIQLVEEAAEEETAEAAVSYSMESHEIKTNVVNTACEYLGVRYVYGGASPSGFDCSGFTMYIYQQFGYALPHSATSQLDYGTSVERDALQMGDLVFFRDPNVTSKAASHVGIYIGGGQFVHASSSSTGYVIVSSLSESYFDGYYVGARRLIAD